ncbi:unnamed protein product, partial [Acanthocheilonema viteae]
VISENGTKNNNSNNQINTLSLSDTDDKLNDITNGSIEKQGQVITKAPEAEISAEKENDSLKDSITTSPETDLLSVMTTMIDTAMMQSVNHPEQFTDEPSMLTLVSQTSIQLPFESSETESNNQTKQSEQLEVDNVDDSDAAISFDTSSSRGTDEFMAQDDGSEKGVEQDSTLSMINEESDREESEPENVDETETVQNELKTKSVSLQIEQQQDESGSDTSSDKQNDNEDSEVERNKDEMQSERKIAEMDEMISKENDEENEQKTSDDTLEAPKKMMEKVEETISIEEESKDAMKNMPATDRKKAVNAKTPSSKVL